MGLEKIDERIKELDNETQEAIDALKKDISKHEDLWEAKSYLHMVVKHLDDNQKERDDLIRAKNIILYVK